MKFKDRQCKRCEEWKPFVEFNLSINWCWECDKSYSREYFHKPHKREVWRVYRINRTAKQRGLPHTLTIEQWQHALNYFGGCCAVCGRQLNDMFEEFRAAADHWIPLISGGDDNPGSAASNIVPLCHGVGGCNNSKNYIMPNVWLDRKFSKKKAAQIKARIQAYFDSLQ